MELKLKTGRTVKLSFDNYSYLEFRSENKMIKPGSIIYFKSDFFIIDRILMDSIVLIDPWNNTFNISKGEFSKSNWEVLDMEGTINQNFITFCNYLGTGDIKGKIWFAGIEEGGASVTEVNLPEQLDLCKKKTQYLDDASGKSSVWNIISELLYDKIAIKHQLDSTSYRKKMFSEGICNFFLTELFPLPKPKTSSWSDDYVRIFGYSGDDYNKYISDVRAVRYPLIYEKWIEAKPLITICFGSGYWNEFVNLFKLGHSGYNTPVKNRIYHYAKENIVLAPFFDYRKITRQEIEVLQKFISNLDL